MESLGFTAIPAITVICYLIAQIVKATALTAIAIGIVSGLAATGVNQIVKQLGQK